MLFRSSATSGPSFLGTNLPDGQIGTARVRGIQYSTGTPGTAGAQYKLYLTDINMSAGYSFKNVKSIGYNPGVGYALGKADVYGTTGSNLSANTVDSSYDRAVFRLPSTSTRKLRNSSGSVNNDYWFYKAYDITFNTAGQYVLSTGDTSEI